MKHFMLPLDMILSRELSYKSPKNTERPIVGSLNLSIIPLNEKIINLMLGFS